MLLDFFSALRQAKLPVTLPEYLTLLDAMSNGIGIGSLDNLYITSRMVLVKDESLYDRFDLDFESSLDLAQPNEYWERYLYFNAGWFFGPDPVEFGRRFAEYAVSVRDDPPAPLIIQPLDPWLDQVVLPLVIHSFGGGRPGPELDGLDGNVTCHYRVLPLFYARESDAAVAALEAVAAPHKTKKWLKQYDPFKRTIYQGRGQKVRALFDQNNLPRKEKALRNKIKSAGFWMR